MTTVAQQSMRQSIALNNHKQRKSRHDDDDESSWRYHRRSTLINATSILNTYEIGNSAERNYSNNILVARLNASVPTERATKRARAREKEREGERERERYEKKKHRWLQKYMHTARKCSSTLRPRRTRYKNERDTDKGSLSRAQR